MKVLQANCARTLATCQAALEVALEIGVGVVCIQEPYLGRQCQKFTHGAFQIRWPELLQENQRQTRVALAIRRDLLEKYVWEERTDLVQHSHVQVLDIWELTDNREKQRRTRVINVYDQNIQVEGRNTRPVKEVQWGQVLVGRVVLLGDFNAKSPSWDPHGKPRNASSLEGIIEEFDLILNNDTTIYTREQGESKSVIDLTFTTPSLGLLESWAVLDKAQVPSDHRAIVLEYQEARSESAREAQKEGGQVTGWKIDKLSEEKKEKMAGEWHNQARGFPQEISTAEDLEREARWIQETLTTILNRHAPLIRITPFSKRWWNDEVREARQRFSRAHRQFAQGQSNWEMVRQSRNAYYTTIRREKRRMWQRFLQGEQEQEKEQEQGQGHGQEKGGKGEREDNSREQRKIADRCWVALKYSRPRDPAHTPAIRVQENGQERQISTIEGKERVFLAQAFPPQEDTQRQVSWDKVNMAQIHATEEEVKEALFSQSIKKAPGISYLNFKALRLLWNWDCNRIISVVQKSIQLGYYPIVWKRAKGILLRKPDKPDYAIPKAYRVISLLECLGKVVEKVVAGKVASFCESHHILHEGQFGSRKNRSTHDALLKLISFVEKAWKKGNVAGAIFMDVKGAFDRVTQSTLIQTLIGVGLAQNLVKWISSFLSNRTAQLVIDGFTCPLRDISAGLPQGSPLSPILFIIYLHTLLKKIDEIFPDKVNASFVDDIGFIAEGKDAEEVAKLLGEVGSQLVHLGGEYQTRFDEEKTEAVLFTRKRRQLQKIGSLQVQLPNFTCKFQKEATRWLGFWLNSKLSFKEHFHIRYQRAEKVLRAIAPMAKRNGLPLNLVRKIQVATVQSVLLYGSELWWEGQRCYQEKVQKLLNKQARAITGLFSTTPIPFLQAAADLPPAKTLLDVRRLRFTLRCLRQPEGHPSRSTLPPSLLYGEFTDPASQFSSDQLDWEVKEKGGDIGKRLARTLRRNLPTSLENGIEFYHEWKKPDTFPGQVLIYEKWEAERLARIHENGAYYTDGSRLEGDQVGAGVAWRTRSGWKQKSWHLGRNKVVLDAELFAISQAMQMALSQRRKTKIFTDAEAALKMIKSGQAWPTSVRRIWEDAEKLQKRGTPVILLWTPAHVGVPGNERADKAAKKGAQGGKDADPTTSLLYIKERITKRQNDQRKKIHPLLGSAPKALSARLLQLRCGHAAIGTYRKRFLKSQTEECECGERRQDTTHLVLRCKRWRHQRKRLFKSIKQEGVYVSPRLDEKDAKRVLNKGELVEHLLLFLKETQIGLLGKKGGEEDEWLDQWDIQLLDPGGGEEGEVE
jgi:ribonuclease HI